MSMRILICFGIVASLSSVLVIPTPINATQFWQITQLDASQFPLGIVNDKRARSLNDLPDGRIATNPEKGTIEKAWYSQPTNRYGHGILGDGIEAGGLVAVTANGLRVEYELPKTEVFEDITPRLADLDGDGTTEIITIISSLRLGASLGVFQVKNNRLQRLAQSSYIGLANRWLNIAGIADYTGSHSKQIAIVVTPHIGGRLDLFTFDGNALQRIATHQGFSNHVIGSREQRLSASYLSQDGKRMILALPSANRKALRMMSYSSHSWSQLGEVALPAPIDKAIIATGRGDNVEFTLGLSNGTVYSVTRRDL